MLFWSCWVGTNFWFQIKPCVFSVSFLFFGLELLLRCGIFFSWSELEAAVSGGKFCSVSLHTGKTKTKSCVLKYNFNRNYTSALCGCRSSTLIPWVWFKLGEAGSCIYFVFPFSVLISQETLPPYQWYTISNFKHFRCSYTFQERSQFVPTKTATSFGCKLISPM